MLIVIKMSSKFEKSERERESELATNKAKRIKFNNFDSKLLLGNGRFVLAINIHRFRQGSL
jgi:hypothetical protein